MKKTMACLSIITALTLSSCSEGPNNTDIGTISGGVIGGLLGSQFGGGAGKVAAAAGGAMIGAFLGNKIGASMDETDKLKAQQALNSQQQSSWTNKQGNTYTVAPKPTYVKNNQVCRQYVTTATIDGKAETIKGTACQQPDGTWKPV